MLTLWKFILEYSIAFIKSSFPSIIKKALNNIVHLNETANYCNLTNYIKLGCFKEIITYKLMYIFGIK